MKTIFAVTTFLALVPMTSARAQEPRKEALVDKVRTSIELGVQYLRQVQAQRADGSFETESIAVNYPGGITSLALLAMMNAGVPGNDPAIKKGLKYLRGVEPQHTYVVALQTMALAEANQPAIDMELIRRNVQWLMKARLYRDGRLTGWSYRQKAGADKKAQAHGEGDNSNTQYALLGLWAGKQAGVDIDTAAWKEILEFYRRTQVRDGSWRYFTTAADATDDGFGNERSLTMTVAGLCGLLIAGMELNDGREILHADGTIENCGKYQENEALAKAFAWIGKGFALELAQRTYYNLYGLERAGRLSGLRFLGKYDWYREGCKYLTKVQKPDGSWTAVGHFDQWPTVNTSFALLFLSKGRTPVLISKLVHTERWSPQMGRPETDTDWNNDRNDLRHLVDYCSKELFHRLPLAWQNFDMMRAARPGNGQNLTEEDLLETTSELLQAPILYITGHRSPRERLLPVEKNLLKRYIDNGGFILAEACCGSPEFDQGFKTLAQELWPDSPLEYLDGQHPVWTARVPVQPGSPYKLMGINSGCKTVLVYSPQDLSCYWENPALREKNGRSQLAYRLGLNIVAYATGLEPPRPRLSFTKVVSTKDDQRTIPRGFLKVAQLKHRGDWQPAPRAMRNLMDYLNDKKGIDVALQTEELQAGAKSIIDFKFIYMQGRGEFSFTPAQLKYLRFNLETGGLLFADACCGKEAFDKAFRKFMGELFPKHKLEQVPADDLLFGARLNGVPLNEETIQCRRQKGGPYRRVPPLLEGIRIDGRWVVLFSKYDIGCALERHKSSDCLGYDTDSAYRIASAAVLYTLTP